MQDSTQQEQKRKRGKVTEVVEGGDGAKTKSQMNKTRSND